MKLSFRWYGEKDPVSLKNISQIPNMRGIVSALNDVPAGEVWPLDKIHEMNQSIERSGLKWEVVESVPVHEDIKLGLPSRDVYIENYKKTIKNLAESGIKVICYNFMSVFDWLRSNLYQEMEDGSTTLAYDDQEISKMDPLNGDLDLPGWGATYNRSELQHLLRQYQKLSAEDLWDHLSYFLRQIIPVAEQHDMKLAIHPDDPPWPVFGLPRVITNKASLQRVIDIIDSPSNGLTVCTGSLGAHPENDVKDIVQSFCEKERVHFLHFRNVKINEDHSFFETGHPSSEGSLNMFEIMEAAVQAGFDGPIRPDHGRMIWGEKGNPGYGLYDRALGASYINGLLEAIEQRERSKSRDRVTESFVNNNH